jgi:hypothetical protein
MNGFWPVGGLLRNIQNYVADVRQSRFFRDRLSVTLLTGALLLNFINMLWLVFHVKPTDAQVPVRYDNLLVGFDKSGPWYFPFLLALFALAVTLLNSMFAYNSFRRNRLASFYLLTGAGVVAIFSLIISTAFGVIR